MKKRILWVSAAGLVAALVAGGLFASNMGFKLNYLLNGPAVGVSASGTAPVGLPYHQQTNIILASDLINDINTVAGGVDPRGDGVVLRAQLGNPRAMVQLPGREQLLVADGTSGRIRLVDLAAGVVSTVVGFPGRTIDAQAPGPGARLSRNAIDRSERPDAMPREISSRSARLSDRLDRVRCRGRTPPAREIIPCTVEWCRPNSCAISFIEAPCRQRSHISAFCVSV